MAMILSFLSSSFVGDSGVRGCKRRTQKRAFTLSGLDDVENYGLVTEADNSLPIDIHNQVFQLVRKPSIQRVSI
ncbi:unnamed protein product [Arabis nemorensis]|uniref:Uncharacterized protein n=1 Tax=Arabis nemorensis TaxID=586526 RepID=A0A565C607_9BRAS|nr:unnamed protein product [Arabis nemorensis]